IKRPKRNAALIGYFEQHVKNKDADWQRTLYIRKRIRVILREAFLVLHKSDTGEIQKKFRSDTEEKLKKIYSEVEFILLNGQNIDQTLTSKHLLSIALFLILDNIIRMTDLHGLVALVTGGASGLGLGVVRRFIKEGAKVAVADLPISKGNEIVEELGESATFIPMDVSTK
ncbi:unnamed protein product, partial [Heterotrigona itama]